MPGRRGATAGPPGSAPPETSCAQLGRQTSLVAWLNPMPRDRWSGTSARIVAGLVPMFPLEPEGLGHAVDVLRGLSPPHAG